MEITHVHKLTVPVTDQDVAKAFYVGKLGFELRGDLPVPMGENSRWIEVAPKGAQTTLVLCDWLPDAPKLRGAMLATKDTDLAVAALRDAGVAIDDPQRTPWGNQATFADPDGNTFILTDGPA
ncbi:VOC family protein [Nonomuraea jiangxiensis]|uniref:Catechol 2,3-dioxygenase n=1 Tax=Nonomuraea jiangxiensis TaxID=633440 RepID=A0A1G8W8F3_9ACTN|nr:VOC family protein [Nonomuraea jiangxiensis]SDJ74572.1 Catechol 2,3-dioxygenase [Nonomuraea jiangxiensis]